LSPNVVDVFLTEAALARRGRRHLQVAYSSCSLCAKEAVADICRNLPPLAGRLTLTTSQLVSLMARLLENQPIFQQTGGTHGVALASPDGAFFLCAEDVGRHNAMDKVIGRALLERRDFGGLVALLSGRISFEMALKTARAGIPLLAAVSAPTTMALQLAQELNLTLAGFVRGERFNLYTHPERLAG
jgi:FdhD protein